MWLRRPSAPSHQVNQRESLLRREGVRLLKRPSALLPPHAVLEHVLGSLRTPDFPTDGVGLQQASTGCRSRRTAAPLRSCVRFSSVKQTVDYVRAGMDVGVPACRRRRRRRRVDIVCESVTAATYFDMRQRR